MTVVMSRHAPRVVGLRVGLAALAVAILVALAGLILPDHLPELAYLLLVIGTAGLVLVCVRKWSLSPLGKRLDYWEPPTAFSILALSYAALGFLAFLTNDARFRVHELDPDNSRLIDAVALMAFALAAFWIGYRAGARLLTATRVATAHPVAALRRHLANPSLAMTLIVYSLVLVLHVWRLFAGSGTFDAPGLGAAEQPVDDIVSLGYFVLALAAVQVFLKRWPPIALYVILAPEVFFASLTAFISSVVVIGIIVMGALYYAGPQVRVRWLLFFAVLVLVITPVTVSMRVQIRTGHAYFGSIGALADSAWQGFSDTWLTAPAEAANTTYSKLIGRVAGNIQILGVVLRYVPARTPFLGTQDLVAAPLFVVPRFLWPDKPSPSLIGGLTSLLFLNEENNSVTPTTFGDLYLHGGLSAVAIYMFLLGLLLGIEYRILLPKIGDAVSPVLLACWLSLTYTVINPESAYGSMIQALMQKPFLILLTALLICFPRFGSMRRPLQAVIPP
jgi:Putative O-antigen polymerase